MGASTLRATCYRTNEMPDNLTEEERPQKNTLPQLVDKPFFPCIARTRIQQPSVIGGIISVPVLITAARDMMGEANNRKCRLEQSVEFCNVPDAG